jgi:hypothetical protein
VDRVERGAQSQREAVIDAEREKRAEVEASIPPAGFEIPLEDLGLPPSLGIKISGEGYSTIGDLMLQLKLDSDRILAINGVGPKALDTIQQALDSFKFPEVAKPEPAPEPIAAEPEAEPEPVAQAIPEPVAEPEVAVKEEIEVEEVEEKPTELSEEDEKLLAEMQGSPVPQAPVQPGSVEEIFARTEKKLLGRRSRKPQAGAGPAQEPEKKKAKKKKPRELEYDPETDTTVIRRRREDWEEE